MGYIIWIDPNQGLGADISENYTKMDLGASVVPRFADVLHSIDGKASFHFICF